MRFRRVHLLDHRERAQRAPESREPSDTNECREQAEVCEQAVWSPAGRVPQCDPVCGVCHVGLALREREAHEPHVHEAGEALITAAVLLHQEVHERVVVERSLQNPDD